MKIKHNKKRNVGLVFDQLSRLLSESVIKGDTETSRKCAKIIAEHFRKGTVLHDEMRLFRSLSGVTIKNDALLLRVLDESRIAAKSIDVNQLSREKTKLIKSLNESFGKDEIFNMKNSRFRTLASIQVLLNEWRKSSGSDIVSVLEDSLITEMKRDSVTPQVKDGAQTATPGVTSLVVELAKRKFFQKHKSLSHEQVKSLFEMITSSEDDNRLVAERVAKTTLDTLNNYIIRECRNKSEYFVSTLQKASRKIQETDFSSLDNDQIIGRTITMKKLMQEMINE